MSSSLNTDHVGDNLGDSKDRSGSFPSCSQVLLAGLVLTGGSKYMVTSTERWYHGVERARGVVQPREGFYSSTFPFPFWNYLLHHRILMCALHPALEFMAVAQSMTSKVPTGSLPSYSSIASLAASRKHCLTMRDSIKIKMTGQPNGFRRLIFNRRVQKKNFTSPKESPSSLPHNTAATTFMRQDQHEFYESVKFC